VNRVACALNGLPGTIGLERARAKQRLAAIARPPRQREALPGEAAPRFESRAREAGAAVDADFDGGNAAERPSLTPNLRDLA
jgi:hypothetical protein